MPHISLKNTTIPYTLKVSSRAKCLRLSVYRGGELIVVAPTNYDLSRIEKFILQKSRWVLQKIEYFSKLPVILKRKKTKAEFRQYRDEARILVENKIEKFNQIYNFNYGRISIRDQKTRWGSCSKKGNLSFNYKIALLPENLADYIIVHELCHLKEFNHSPKFWSLVQSIIPDYISRRKDLRNARATLQ